MAICRVASRVPWSRRFFGSGGGCHLEKAVEELNKEMEFVFGEPSASSPLGSTGNKAKTTTLQDSRPLEMESVFGESSASSPFGSIGNHSMITTLQAAQVQKQDFAENAYRSTLTHIDNKGKARMVDVSLKEISKRVAIASCKVILGMEVFGLVSSNQMGKGDVLSVAKIAGICGAKQTSSLIPLYVTVST